MDRNALRYSARQIMGWFLVVVTGTYVWAFLEARPEDQPAALLYAVVFAGIATYCFIARYRDFLTRQARAAEQAAFAERIAEQRAEHEKTMAELDANRKAREQAREDQERDDIAQGKRCPEWCTNCAADRAESERVNAQWLAERARRHGHPNPADVAEMASRPTVRVL